MSSQYKRIESCNWATNFVLRDGTKLSRSSAFTSDGTDSNINSSAHSSLRSNPVTNFIGLDHNKGNARVVLVSLVNSVPEISKPG